MVIVEDWEERTLRLLLCTDPAWWQKFRGVWFVAS
jgi:hypothetical protein